MAYQIPLFKLNFDEQEIQAVTETIQSRWISTGPMCEELESVFRNDFQVLDAVSVANCTDALHLACILCGIGVGDEVLCPSLTFAASVNCVRYVGAIPVFCDIKSIDHINISAEEIEKKITYRTKAIVVVHMAGFPAEMDTIVNLAQKYNLKIIEDACHAPLSEYKGKKLGTIGDVGCFSFFSNKNVSAGEGGMLITNNEKMAKRARLLRSHGMTTMSFERASGHATSYDIVELGYNFRMDDIRASIVIAQMRKLYNDLLMRSKVRSKYIEGLSDLKDIIIPFEDNKEFVSNYIMPIVLRDSTRDKRDAIRSMLHSLGIQTSVHYPAIHRFSLYQTQKNNLPLTEYVSDNEITLPMYASLTDEEIKYICMSLKNVLTNYEIRG